jgi:hypothetical protein
MPFQNPDDRTQEYRTLEDLITELIARPGTLFMRDRGCEALVYVPEFDEILLIECKNVLGSSEVCEEALRIKLRRIVRPHD